MEFDTEWTDVERSSFKPPGMHQLWMVFLCSKKSTPDQMTC